MKKLYRIFALLLALLLVLTSCSGSEPKDETTQNEDTAQNEDTTLNEDVAADEIDREIDVNLDGYYQAGGIIELTEKDIFTGEPISAAYGGIGILAAEGETIGSALEASGYSDLNPILEGDVFEGWMAVIEEIEIDEFGDEESVSKAKADHIYTTEELLALTVPDHEVSYVAKWASIPAESYFEPIDPWETDDVTTSGSFSFSANGGMMVFSNAEGSENRWPEYGYWLEDGQTLSEAMESEYADTLTGAEKEAAEFCGWTLYEAESIFMNEEPVEEEGILCFPYDSGEYYYTILKNPVLVGENIPTEQLFGMTATGTNYFAIAAWSE